MPQESPPPPPADSPLRWDADGQPRSARFGDIYFQPDDGLAETRAVFLDGCGMPGAWAGRSRFVVAELGFGTGLNIASLLHLWRRTREPDARLHIFSVEAFPVAADDAARALGAFPEIAEEAAMLTRRWPAATPGFHRVDLPEAGAVLDLAVMDAAEALAAWSGAADAWFLDGFAPAVNPAMWRDEVLALVAERSAAGARAATFTVAGQVRRGLESAGFEVARVPGFGRKKQRLEAVLDSPPSPASRGLPPEGEETRRVLSSPLGGGGPEGTGGGKRVVIIGAGIAGASLARAFRVLGYAPTVIAPADLGASGNPAALVSPRFDVSGGAAAQLSAQAFERAAALYAAEAPGAIIATGAVQLEAQERDAARFDLIAESPLFAPNALDRLTPDAAGRSLGEQADRGGLWIADALTVEPQAIVPAWLEGVEIIRADVARLAATDDGWSVLDAAGQSIATGSTVCIAAGAGAAALTGLDLRPVRGQVSFTRADEPITASAWGGYAIPTRDGVLFGATHDRGDLASGVRGGDHVRNLALLGEGRPALAARLVGRPLEGRAAIRAATRDHLPAAGALKEPGLFALTGLGGRGFTLAPLLAEHIAALAAGAASPLPYALAKAVDPLRLDDEPKKARGR